MRKYVVPLVASILIGVSPLAKNKTINLIIELFASGGMME
jgi:hypothetical protein